MIVNLDHDTEVFGAVFYISFMLVVVRITHVKD